MSDLFIELYSEEIPARLQKSASQILKEVIDQHGAVVFGGDGYSNDWHQEAIEKRGLENLRNTAEALPVLQRNEVKELKCKIIKMILKLIKFIQIAPEWDLARSHSDDPKSHSDDPRSHSNEARSHSNKLTLIA